MLQVELSLIIRVAELMLRIVATSTPAPLFYLARLAYDEYSVFLRQLLLGVIGLLMAVTNLSVFSYLDL